MFTHGLPADALVFSPNLTAGPNGTLATFVPPQPHTLYAAHLVATNAAGLTAVSPTRFLLYDPSPPIDGTVTVCDGLDPIEAQSSTSNLTLCISGARAPMSELQAYRISIYNASSGAQIGPVLEVPPLPTADGHGGLVAQLRGLELPCTAQLTVLTQAMSGAGVAAAPQSHALRTDCTPPFVKAIVTRRAHGDVELGWPRTSASCSNVHGSDLVAEWEPFDEPDGRVASYTYSLLPVVGDGPEGEAQYVGLQRHVRLGNLSSRGLSAAPGTYALRVRACNDASGCSGWSMASNELLFTSDAPGAGAITVTNAAAPGFLTNTTSLAAAWVGFDDATAAATALQHEVCVGTTPYGCQLLPLHGYPTTNDSWSNGSLPMLCGSTYYVTVRSINCAGLQRIDASTGRKLCCTPPTSGVLKLTDGDGGAVLFVGNEADLAAYWKGFVDECSGVRGYTLTLRAKADGALVWASAELPPNASVAMVPASVVGALAGDATYELTLTCTSRATLTSSVTYSFGVDWTPPEPPPPQLRWALSSAAAWRGPDEGPLCIPANASAVEVGWSAYWDLGLRDIAEQRQQPVWGWRRGGRRVAADGGQALAAAGHSIPAERRSPRRRLRPLRACVQQCPTPPPTGRLRSCASPRHHSGATSACAHPQAPLWASPPDRLEWWLPCLPSPCTPVLLPAARRPRRAASTMRLAPRARAAATPGVLERRSEAHAVRTVQRRLRCSSARPSAPPSTPPSVPPSKTPSMPLPYRRQHRRRCPPQYRRRRRLRYPP